MQCEYCEGEISQSALACRHCGRETLVGKRAREEERDDRRRPFIVTMWCIVILVGAFFLFGLMNPRTDVQRCIDHNGEGAWFASSGVTLEDFCKASVGLANLEQDRKEHPERY